MYIQVQSPPLRRLGALVLCCDGVTDVLSNERIASVVGRHAAVHGARRAAEAVSLQKKETILAR